MVRKKTKFVIYRKARGWRWKLVAVNGEVVARGGEPFKSASNAKRAVRRTVNLACAAYFEPIEYKR